MLEMTGSLFQYFSPTHSRRELMLSRVTGSMSRFERDGIDRRACGGGGERPARTRDEMKPARWRASMRRRLSRVEGMEVRERRAREQLERWERACERVVRDPIWWTFLSLSTLSFQLKGRLRDSVGGLERHDEEVDSSRKPMTLASSGLN